MKIKLQYSDVQFHVTDPFLVLDNEWKIKYANPQGIKFLGGGYNNLIDRVIWDVTPIEFKNLCFEHFQAAKLQNEKTQMETVYIDKSIRVIIYPHDQGGSILIEDITEQRRIEEAIIENNNKLILLTKAANHIISSQEPNDLLDSLFEQLSRYLDLDMYFNYILEEQKLRLINYHGIPQEVAEEFKWLEFGEGVSGCVARDECRIIVENIHELNNQNVQMIRRLGFKACACYPLMSYGKLIGTLCFGSRKRSHFTVEELDLMEKICNQVAKTLERTALISALKAKNQELSVSNIKLTESERRFREIFEGAMDGILIENNDGIIVRANETACSLFGVRQEECIGKHFIEFISKKAATAAMDQWNQLMVDGKIVGETVIRVSDQSEITIGFSAKKDIYPDHHVFIFRDISSQKQLEVFLLQAKEEAEKASKAKSDFLSMMSHELRTPMNSILGFSQILLYDKTETLSEKQKHRVTRIQDSSQELLKLINEILDLVRIESGALKFEQGPVIVGDLINDSIKTVETFAVSRNIHVTNKSGVLEHYILVSDYTRLKQILVNLLVNAIKYNHLNGQVEIHSEINQDNLIFSIKDTGIGIPKNECEKIFEPFYRIYSPEMNIEGTGIGLTLVKRIVNELGGNVWVTSHVGKGSTFCVSFPVMSSVSSRSAFEYTGVYSKTITPEFIKSRKVLYIEDNMANIELMDMIFESHEQLKLFIARDGVEGIQKAKELKPDLILLDIQIPQKNGYEVYRDLQSNPITENIPVIAITADAMNEDIEKARIIGFKEYVTKPFDYQELLMMIQKYS